MPGLVLAVLVYAAAFVPAVLAEPVWIDVRSPEEFREDGIAGDLNLPHEDILQALPGLLPDRTTELRLYCGSGRRAGIAMEALEAAGYRNLSNAGGIDEVREARGLD